MTPHYRRTDQEEREHIRRAVASLRATVGERPPGWRRRYGPSLNTRRLAVEEGGFLQDSDARDGALPRQRVVDGRPHLVAPCSLANNDGKFRRGRMASGGSSSKSRRTPSTCCGRKAQRRRR
ncbi:MAG: hypothetical protein ACK4WC_06275 [Rubrimonas sp.]